MCSTKFRRSTGGPFLVQSYLYSITESAEPLSGLCRAQNNLQSKVIWTRIVDETEAQWSPLVVQRSLTLKSIQQQQQDSYLHGLDGLKWFSRD